MSKAKKLSRTEIVNVIENAGGSIMNIGFIKKDKTKRFITGNVNKSKRSKLGYIYFNDFSEKEKKIKSIDPRTIFYLKSKGLEYSAK